MAAVPLQQDRMTTTGCDTTPKPQTLSQPVLMPPPGFDNC